MTRSRIPTTTTALLALVIVGGASALAAAQPAPAQPAPAQPASTTPAPTPPTPPTPSTPSTPPTPADEDQPRDRAVERPAPATAPTHEPDWEQAPRPDQASGVAEAEPLPIDEQLKWIPRAILFVPRWAFWAVAQPVRYGAYASERYQIPKRVRRLLLSEDETYGVYPVATYESGFGIDAGARFFHKDLFGAREQLRLRANFGGRYRQAYGINMRSGRRLGEHFSVELDLSYARRPIERFYGIGDTELVDLPGSPGAPGTPLDPDGGLGYPTRFREDLARAIGRIEVPLVGALAVRTSGALVTRTFAGTGEDDSLEMVYDTSQLPGWTTGVDNAYLEAEVVYDSRRPASAYQTKALDGTGWLAAAHVGRMFALGDESTPFTRYGGEVQRYIDLYDGSRILALRALVEATAGDVTFIDQPRLGGTEYLRGYPSSRFRDKAITLATAEYTWDLGNFMSAYAFVDVGRVWPSLADVRLDDSLRVGYGGGVQLHTFATFLTRFQLAASRDGDVLLELALSPAFGRRERGGRF